MMLHLHLLHMHPHPRINAHAHVRRMTTTTTLHLLPRLTPIRIRRRKRHAIMRFVGVIPIVGVGSAVEPATRAAAAAEVLVGAGAWAAGRVVWAVVFRVEARGGWDGRPLIMLGESVVGG